jgi:D-sedoheptulose 7-phosphate isomerase
MDEKSNLIKKRIEESISAKKSFLSQTNNIEKASDAIVRALKNKGKVLVFGNGGSAADSQHIAGELIGKFMIQRKALPAIALSTDTSVLTSWSNDYSDGFENVFSRQIEALASPGDVLIGITTSGNSENVIRAFKKGREIGTVNISLTGKDGGRIKPLSDININSDSNETPRIQECHEVAYHIICELVEKEMAGF